MSRDDRELKRITPFVVRAEVAFTPDERFSGYKITASSFAEIGNKGVVIPAYPRLTFITAQWLYSLSFEVGINADSVVPLVNKANKD